MKIYLVGGAIRDKLLGVKTKDYDYVMVLDNIKDLSVQDGFKIMETYMINEGFTIYQSKPDMYTISAKFPNNHVNKGLTADFVLARKEIGYTDDSRQPMLELGTFEDDLGRRDFTINAMAEDEDGNIIDLFNGLEHLKYGILQTPKDPMITLLDDPLRLIRALRFSVTKNFNIHFEVLKAMKNPDIITKMSKVVSQERIQGELNKMFQHNTIQTLKLLTSIDNDYAHGLLDVCFKDQFWLKVTNEKKK